jgi:hypothetical protein
MGSKQHEGSNTAYARTDSRITGLTFTGVGVRKEVHTRQQAELTAYRKKQKIFRHRLPAGYEKWFEGLPMQEQLYLVTRQADREAEAAAKQLRKTEATAEADRKTEADKEVEAAASARVSKVEQTAAPATDIFGLIAAAAEADKVVRAEAAEAAAAAAAAAAFLTVRQVVIMCKNCRFKCFYPTFRQEVGFLESELRCVESDARLRQQLCRLCATCLHRCNKWNHGTEAEKAEVYRAVTETRALLHWTRREVDAAFTQWCSRDAAHRRHNHWTKALLHWTMREVGAAFIQWLCQACDEARALRHWTRRKMDAAFTQWCSILCEETR